jgi:hypothetical protein
VRVVDPGRNELQYGARIVAQPIHVERAADVEKSIEDEPGSQLGTQTGTSAGCSLGRDSH